MILSWHSLALCC